MIARRRGFLRPIFLWCCLVVSRFSAEAYSISYSTTPDRSNPVLLDNVTLDADVYIFLDTSQAPAGPSISNVLFELVEFNSTVIVESHLEGKAPYDFQGGTANSATRWNPYSVQTSEFGFTMKVDVTFSDNSVLNLQADFEVDNASFEYILKTSPNSDRSNSVPLEGWEALGLQYIFLEPETNVDSVHFSLDSGALVKNEGFAPYDFQGGTNSNANPWDADAYEAGTTRVITTTVTLESEDVIVFNTFFTISDFDGCNDISYLPCQDIRVIGNFSLDFSSPNLGGIVDKNGIGTGFLMVDVSIENSGPNQFVPGYDSNRLEVDNAAGKLLIEATNGINWQENNNLINAMGVGLNLPSKLVTMETTMDLPPTAVGGWAQSGLWYGAAGNFGRGSTQNNYCKLMVATKVDDQYLVRLQCEIGGSPGGQQTIDNVVALPFPASVRLQMEMDPVNKEVTGFVRFEGQGTILVGTISDVPDEFFSFDQAGLDPTLQTRSMGGIFATNRNSGVQQTFAFQSFIVEESDLPDQNEANVNVPAPEGGLEFDRWSVTPTNGVGLPTGLAYGPDGRVYVLDIFGEISAITLDHENQMIADEQIISAIITNEGGFRLSLGIAIDPHSTPDNVILWVSHSSGSINAGDINSGKVTKISGYPDLNITEDIIYDLPRAYANHALNDIEFGPDNKLYMAFGGNTGAGAPNEFPSEFLDRPEQPLTAAALVADVFDPNFKGSCGTPLYEFGIPANCTVEVFASGLRNSYDLAWHFNGEVYATDNGLGVTGTVPPSFTAPCTGLSELGLNPGKQDDLLQRLEQGFYYGHPNPYRDECVFKDGSFQSLYFEENVDPLPNYKEPLFSLGASLSANGIIVYNNCEKFFGKLCGDILIVNFSSGDSLTRTVLALDGKQVVAHGVMEEGFQEPLPIEQDGEGRVYIGEFGASSLTILVPRPMTTDPVGNWTYQGDAPTAVLNPASTTLNDRLYMIGGTTDEDGAVNDAWVYNPFQDEWTAITDAPFENEVENAAAAVYQGRVYVFGGSTFSLSGVQSHAAYYDPAFHSWTFVADMPTARGGATAQELNGMIYVMGGMDDSGHSLDTVEIFDPENNSWSTGPSLQEARMNPVSAVLNGNIYIMGGLDRATIESTNAPTTSPTNATTDIPTSSPTNVTTSAPTSAPTNGTRRLIVEVARELDMIVETALDSVEVLGTASNYTNWTYATSMPTARRGMAVGKIGGRLQVVGGQDDSVVADVNEEYDPEDDSWRSLTEMSVVRYGAAFGTIRGKLYVACGDEGAMSYSNETEVFAY